MSTTYSAADTDVNELLAEVMQRWHKPLHEAAVKVGVLMSSELKAGGYPAYATIKVVSLKDRLSKQYDAELVIDHELSHIKLAKARTTGDAVLAQTESGITFERDDLGRPKLKLVKGDWNGGDGFKEVVKRNRDFAIEFLNARRCHVFATAARDGIEPSLRAAADNLLDSLGEEADEKRAK